MKKRLLSIISSTVMILSLCACSSKEPITTDTFKAYFDGNDKYIVDTVSLEEEGFESYTFAMSADYTIDFYVLDDDGYGAKAYAAMEDEIEDQNPISHTMVNMGKTSKYSGNTSDTYYVVSRIGNTLIYSEAPIEFKDEIKGILDFWGY